MSRLAEASCLFGVMKRPLSDEPLQSITAVPAPQLGKAADPPCKCFFFPPEPDTPRRSHSNSVWFWGRGHAFVKEPAQGH